MIAFFSQVLRIAGPYGFAALAGTMSEIGGVVNIALEGMLLVGALSATLAAYGSGSPWLALAAGALGGAALAALHAWAALNRRVDQVVSGLACNYLAAGACRFVLKLVFHSTSNSARIEGFSTTGMDPLPFVFFACVALSHVLIFKTKFGLRLRAVGEHPKAVETLGLSVLRLRWSGVLLSGALAGLGGAYLALEQHQFTDGMSGGRGYIALAAVILGRWTPLGAAIAAVLFAAAESSQIILQSFDVRIPTQFIQLIPYFLTLAAVAGVVGRSRPPAADGVPYAAEQD